MIRVYGAVLLCLMLAGPSTGLGREAPPASKQAAELHLRAVKEVGKGRFAHAIVAWEGAEALDPTWKYAFNLASVFAHEKHWLRAWDACQRARQRGVPEANLAALQGIEQVVGAGLLETHAWVELDVDPPDALVTRDGRPWPGPRREWTTVEADELTVSAPGFVSQSRRWVHQPGVRYHESVRLQPVPRLGEILVRGAPAGATVSIDGRPAGTLPDVRAEGIAPGPHDVLVEHPAHTRVVKAVTVVAGEVASLDVALDPVPVAIVSPPIVAPRRDLRAWKWTATLTGTLAVATGAGLLGWSEKLAKDSQSLNETASSWPDYDFRYEALSSDHDAAATSGYVLLGVGGALAVAGVVLFVLDREPGDVTEPSHTTIVPAPLPGGAQITATMSF